MEPHKEVERRRYDDAAARTLRSAVPDRAGAASAPPEFRAPYQDYEDRVRDAARPAARVLEIGAGEGAFSLVAAGNGRILVATDISSIALKVASERARLNGATLYCVVADAERLPLRDASMDLVTSAGVLYCLDMERVSTELRRVLRPDGAWVLVDSLDESPIYRFNRWVGFLRRRRTQLATENIPTTESLLTLRRRFASVDIRYQFLAPVLKPLIGAERTGRIVHRADRWLAPIRRWAFKVVVVARGMAGR
jgi:ubiquinone/menaquinone biosynthesis C-methylase UbiE